MAAWQVAKNFEATGILTTVQRAALLRDYNAVFDGLGLKRITETTSGIEMLLPMQVVGFSRYEPPFVHFDATGDLEAKVLLISQAGDRDTLFGLYDIMQTLEIVPLTGPRDRNSSGFTLIGQNARMISETRVTLRDGQIKGFTLIWPTGDEARRTRIIEEMDKSFVRLGGVLDPAAGAPDAQSIDLISGLKIRKPRLSRSGFFVNANGAVVTTSEAVQSCTRITLDQDFEATVAAEDSDRGIAILKPDDALAPTRIAEFSATAPRLQSDVAVAGYSFEDVLNAPTMTFGTLADLRGLGGEEDLKRLDLAPLPGDAGGPVFDANGNVLGMLLPRSRGAQQLPEAVSFALTGGAIATVMERAGLSVTSGTRTVPLDAEDITARGVGMTVLVSCWD
jgi:S1-C subfamily serine protease